MILDGLTLEEAKDIIKDNKRPMESVIKWQTGFPTKKGRYILSIEGGKIDMDNWSIYTKNWYHYNNNYVIAWCPLSDIEPYKE